MKRGRRPLTVAISPCPNDTFLWAGLATGAIQPPWPLHIAHYDIDELNRLAREEAFDIIKLSLFQYAHLPRRSYRLLSVGAALGYGVGPLLIAREPLSRNALASARIGLPGWQTTAHSLLHFYAPEAQNRLVYRYDQLIPALLNGEIEAAVLIHELRFTYEVQGLVRIADLGAYWTIKTGFPIPLGGVVIRASLSAWRPLFNAALRESLRWAYAHLQAALSYVGLYADAMDPAVQKAHINLYVNAFTRRLGPKGCRAVSFYLAHARNAIASPPLAHKSV
jgi:1,4-dihydroxy-6-naphthoate synthase